MGHRHSDKFKQETIRIALTCGLTRRHVFSELGTEYSGRPPVQAPIWLMQ